MEYEQLVSIIIGSAIFIALLVGFRIIDYVNCKMEYSWDLGCYDKSYYENLWKK